MNIKNYKLFLDLDHESSEPINEEVGLRNLKKIAKGNFDDLESVFKSHKTKPSVSVDQDELNNMLSNERNCEIYFHKDLDGVTSALAMKSLLKSQYRINCVKCHVIQYGGLEFAVELPKPGNLAVLVDFAHSKPMFTIATDHHQEQTGAEDTSSTYYKHSRSNVETISGEISKQERFPQGDIELIQTIDSANFFKYGITPDDVQNSIFKLDREQSSAKNRFMMGFVVNRLLLAYKNKRITVKSLDGKRDHINTNILECMVLDCDTNLISMYNNIRHYISNARTSDKSGRLATPEEVSHNLAEYIETMKTYKDKSYDEDYKIIQQYGGGSMIKPGSYDRYVTFKNTPESEFLAIIWPIGLIQVSCNPYKEKKLADINLGNIAKEVLSNYQYQLSNYYISLESIKNVYETSQDVAQMQKAIGEGYQAIGFRYSDLEAFYMDCVYYKPDKEVLNILDKVVEIDFASQDDEFKNIKVIIKKGDDSYIFGINDTEDIKEFVSDAIIGDVSRWSDNIGTVDRFESEVSKKQIDGAKNYITNLLKGGNALVIKREKISVFKNFDNRELKSAMDTNYTKLTPKQKSYLSNLKVSMWELIKRNSGGHPSITNISGLNFLPFNKKLMQIMFKTEKYTDVIKRLSNEIVANLKEKIDLVNAGEKIKYETGDLEFSGQEANENFEYHLVDKESGIAKPVSKDEFLKAGAEKGMRTDRKSLMTIDTENRRVIAKFEKFKFKK